jgi:ABC-2 type transport system permease protein
VAADADRGFLEVPLSAPVARARYLLIAIGGQLLALALLAASAVAGILVVGLLVGAEFDAVHFTLAGAAAFCFAAAIVGPTSLVAVLTLNRGLTGASLAGVLVVMYLLEVIAKIQPDLGWLGRLSLMHYFNTTPIVDAGSWPLADAAVLSGVAVLGWAGAVWLFRRRDLAT